MSRKSKRNPSDTARTGAAPVAPPQAVKGAGPKSRRNLFIAAAVALLAIFVAAAFYYRGEQASSAQSMAAKNLPALASEQAPSFGPASAKVHLVEFFDPACETCAAFFPHVKKLMAAHPDRIRLSLRHVPFHPGSEVAVRALEASRQQGKYLQVLEGLYARQDSWVIQHQVQADRVWAVLGGLGLDMDKLRADMNAPEVGQRLARDMDDARLLGVTKTPEFFANGRPMPSFGLEQLQTLVGEELRRAYP